MDVGVIGVGVMGKNHVRVYSELKKVDNLFVYDISKEQVKKVKDFDVIVCDSLDELLKRVEAVSICVPTRYHFEILSKVVERGIHALVEKPITSSYAEGKKALEVVRDIIRNRDIIVGVGHIERFNPIVNEIAGIVKYPSYVEIKRHNPSSIRIMDSSVVEDLMIHDIDIIFHVLFDEKSDFKVYSAGNKDICTALIKFDKAVVFLSASRLSAKKIRAIHIEENEKTVEGDFMTQEVYVYRKPEKYYGEAVRYVQENIIEKVMVNKVEPLKVELKTFLDCVDRGEQFPITPEQAVFNLKVCKMIKNEVL